VNQTNGLKVLAFVIAVILWAYVRVTVGGVTANEVTQLELRVPLETKGAGSHLIPYEKSTDTIKVTLRGDSQVVTELREGLVRARVDLENVAAGSAWPEVQVLVPPGVQIINVDPSSVNVKLSPLMVKEVPVKIDTAGAPKAGFRVGEPVFEPKSVKIEGPEELVSQVSVVSGVVPVEGLGDTLALTVSNLVPINENGTAVMGNDTALRLATREVRATVPIKQDRTLDSLPVLLNNVKVVEEKGFTYKPTVEPQFVQVSTSLDPEELPDGVEVAPIEFDPDGSEPVREEVRLLPMKGVSFMGGKTVTVTMTPQRVPSQNKGDSNSESD
jgi:YbbR domain-containing protein